MAPRLVHSHRQLSSIVANLGSVGSRQRTSSDTSIRQWSSSSVSIRQRSSGVSRQVAQAAAADFKFCLNKQQCDRSFTHSNSKPVGRYRHLWGLFRQTSKQDDNVYQQQQQQQQRSPIGEGHQLSSKVSRVSMCQRGSANIRSHQRRCIHKQTPRWRLSNIRKRYQGQSQ